MSIPIKVMTGRDFLPKDGLGIGQLVWDNTDPVIHRIGGGSGAVSARFYPGVDTAGSLYLNPQAYLKPSNAAYRDNGIGFDGGDVVIRINGQNVARFGSLGLTLLGGILQPSTASAYLPSDTGLGELLFPLFTDKTLIAQFNRPAFAGVDKNNKFHAYRDIQRFLTDFNGYFVRGGDADNGLVRYVDQNRNYAFALQNQPRITYSLSTGKCRGLLIEPTTTNLIAQSYSLASWPGQTGMTLTQESNTDWSSKGLNKPFSFIESQTQDGHFIDQNYTAPPAAVLSLSAFFEAKNFTGTRGLSLFAQNSDSSRCFGVNFSIGTDGKPTITGNRITGSSTVSASDVESVGNGIYRLKVTGVLNPQDNSASGTYQVYVASLGDTPGNTSTVFTPGANTGNWCLVGDVQVEQNPRTTSYIQTSSTPSTRQKDFLQLDLSHYHFSTVEGTFNVNFQSYSLAPYGAVIFSLVDALQTTRIDYVIGGNDGTNYTINAVTTLPGSNPTTATVGTVTIAKSKLSIPYTNIPSNINRLIIDGTGGFNGTFSLISYE